MVPPAGDAPDPTAVQQRGVGMGDYVTASRVDSENVNQRRHDAGVPSRIAQEPDEGAVAASAERILAGAEGGVEGIEDLRVEIGAELRSDRDTVAGISSDLESVHSQLAQINSGIIGLQSNSLRQMGIVALALAVLIAIAWKVIGG
jgi:hypothetical protein